MPWTCDICSTSNNDEDDCCFVCETERSAFEKMIIKSRREEKKREKRNRAVFSFWFRWAAVVFIISIIIAVLVMALMFTSKFKDGDLQNLPDQFDILLARSEHVIYTNLRQMLLAYGKQFSASFDQGRTLLYPAAYVWHKIELLSKTIIPEMIEAAKNVR